MGLGRDMRSTECPSLTKIIEIVHVTRYFFSFRGTRLHATTPTAVKLILSGSCTAVRRKREPSGLAQQ